MMTMDELLAVETIKRNRTLGCRFLDSTQYEKLAELYTDDARCEFGPYGTWDDQSQFARQFAEAEDPFMKIGPFGNLHVIVNHVVDLTGPDTATGIVYLLDFVTDPAMQREGDGPLYWLGVYDEDYRRVDDDWKIARQSLNFIWPERTVTDAFLARHAPTAQH